MVNFRQVLSQGKIEGIEVSPKFDPALFKSLGLEPEDVILSVNDLSMEQLVNTPVKWANLLDADKLNFRIKRNNQILNHQVVW